MRTEDQIALLDYWIKQLDQTIVSLEKARAALVEVKATPPSQVDIKTFWNLLEEARDAATTFDYRLDNGDENIDYLLEAVAGQPVRVILPRLDAKYRDIEAQSAGEPGSTVSTP